MAAIKSLDQIGAKWSRRASGAGQDYREGVQNPKTPWQGAAIAAGPAYRTGVVQAAGRGAFEAGVRRAGEARWQNNAIAKGPGRYSEGVQLAEPEFVAAFQPFHAAIAAIQLPQRQPRGAAANNQRSVAIQLALNQLRLRRQGAST